MNRYAYLASQHWRETDPERYAQIPSPEAFFANLGEEVESLIQELTDLLAGPDLPGEEFLAKVSRLNAARSMAEERALADLVWLTSPQEPAATEAELELLRG